MLKLLNKIILTIPNTSNSTRLLHSMETIDISDLNVHDVILALWKNMEPASFFMFNPGVKVPGQPSRAKVDEYLARSKYIDYLEGRAIKADFGDLTKVRTFLYNRDGGQGAFERIVADLRGH